MRFFFYFALIIGMLTAITLTGYSNGRAGSNRFDPVIAQPKGVYNISFERTGCLGSCPAYVLLLDSAGNTRLTMTGFVEPEAEANDKDDLISIDVTYDWVMSTERHARIVNILEAGGFRRLSLNYAAMATDLETRTISLTTRRGHWSTSVYGMPCERDIHDYSALSVAHLGIERPVPNVFCELADLLHQAACDTLDEGNRQRNRLHRGKRIQLFHPPSCKD